MLQHERAEDVQLALWLDWLLKMCLAFFPPSGIYGVLSESVLPPLPDAHSLKHIIRVVKALFYIFIRRNFRPYRNR